MSQIIRWDKSCNEDLNFFEELGCTNELENRIQKDKNT